MQLLYNSESYAVVRIAGEEDAPAGGQAQGPGVLPAPPLSRAGGYEIVDKLARKEIFLQGAVAASFHNGVKALVEQGPTDVQALEEYIASFTVLAQHPVVLH